MNKTTRACQRLQTIDMNAAANRGVILAVLAVLRDYPSQRVSGMGNEPRFASEIAEQLERRLARMDGYDLWE